MATSRPLGKAAAGGRLLADFGVVAGVLHGTDEGIGRRAAGDDGFVWERDLELIDPFDIGECGPHALDADGTSGHPADLQLHGTFGIGEI